MTNCKQCGAPLHGYKCDYCGTEYKDKFIPHFRVDYCEHPVETLACRVEFPMVAMRVGNEEEIIGHIKSDMAYQISKKLVDYMDVETWIEPKEMIQVFGGRVKVVVPK